MLRFVVGVQGREADGPEQAVGQQRDADDQKQQPGAAGLIVGVLFHQKRVKGLEPSTFSLEG